MTRVSRIAKRTQPPTYYREDSSKLRQIKRWKTEDVKSDQNESSLGTPPPAVPSIPFNFRTNCNTVTIDSFKIFSTDDLTPDDTDLEIIERKAVRISKNLPHHVVDAL